LVSVYYEGLSDEVKDKIGVDPLATLKRLADLSIKTDAWLYKRKLEKGNSGRGYSGPRFQNNGGGYKKNYSKPWEKKREDYGDPMVLGIMNGGTTRSKNYPRPGNREKDR